MRKLLTVLTTAILITSCATITQNPLPGERSRPEYAAEIESAEIAIIEAMERNVPQWKLTAQEELAAPQEELTASQAELTASQEELTASQEELAASLNVFKKPLVALTFDDGPCVFTDTILDILERYDVRATFFVVGKFVENWPKTLLRAVNNGHEVAGHTWHHIRLTDLSNKEIAETIKATSAAIEKVTGVPSSSFFRPPYGEVNRRVTNVCGELGYALINWTVDPQDWRLLNASLIYDELMKTVRENSIILVHEIFKSTVTAMERVIPALIAEGYEFVTVSELMNHLYGEIKPGMVYGAFGLRH